MNSFSFIIPSTSTCGEKSEILLIIKIIKIVSNQEEYIINSRK
ncbi:hypothetical protein [Spiroplasma endosymbiont of Apeira syringaria]